MAREVLPLTKLEPHWLVDMPAHRWGVGVTFRCPAHGAHPIRLLFANPVDGGEPLRELGPLFWRVGETLAELTVLAYAGAEEAPLDVRGHWTGRILHGEVSTERLDSDAQTRIGGPGATGGT